MYFFNSSAAANDAELCAELVAASEYAFVILAVDASSSDFTRNNCDFLWGSSVSETDTLIMEINFLDCSSNLSLTLSMSAWLPVRMATSNL